MLPQTYIAAPFFNDNQIAIVVEIESALKSRLFPFTSPRNDGRVTSVNAADMFQRNIDFVVRANLMIACARYVLPDRVTHRGSDVLPFPDTGVAVEVGIASMSLTPFVVYDPRPGATTHPLNVMFTAGSLGVACGIDELMAYLSALVGDEKRYGDEFDVSRSDNANALLHTWEELT